jgi:hypothetical protein
VAGRFFRPEPRAAGSGVCAGVLAPLAGKNGWTLAEVAGDATPDGMQRLPNAANWDASRIRVSAGSADGRLPPPNEKGTAHRAVGTTGFEPATP